MTETPFSTEFVSQDSIRLPPPPSWITQLMVSSAISIKQSPIPDIFFLTSEMGLEAYRRLDTIVGINDRLISLSQALVKSGIDASGTLATAAIKGNAILSYLTVAGVAYQRTPGYLDNDQKHISSVPGAFPSLSDVREVSTQTDTSNAAHPSPRHARLRKKKSMGEFMGDYIYSATKNANSYMKGESTASHSQVASESGSDCDDGLRSQTELNTNSNRANGRILSTKRSMISLFYGSEELKDTTIGSATSKRNSITDIQDFNDDLIRMNVGGLMFSFTKQMLNHHSDSSLARFFLEDGDSIMTIDDVALGAKLQRLSTGVYFYEADGAAFYYLLNFMRFKSAMTSSDTIKPLLTVDTLRDVYLLERIAQLSTECGVEAFTLICYARISKLRLEASAGLAYHFSRAVIVTSIDTLRGFVELIIWIARVLRITAIKQLRGVDLWEICDRLGRRVDGSDALHVAIQSVVVLASFYIIYEILS